MARSSQGIVSSIRALLPFGDSEGRNATAMLREEHRLVDALFEEFLATDSRAKRREIAAKVVTALRTHTTIEEEIFYPAVRREMGDEEPVACAYEEHGIAKRLLDELDRMKPSDPGFNAKFKVLAESVRHHVREEESEILPQAESSDLDLEALGEEMRQRQRALRSGKSAKRARQSARPASRARRSATAASRCVKTGGSGKAAARTSASGAKRRAGAKKSAGTKKAASRRRRTGASGRRSGAR